MSTVHNPPTPYVGLIPGGLQDGMTIHVTGQPEHHHTGFLVSLQAGGSIDPRSDCAFVFNPRFSDNQVIRNSLMSGSWGAEERHGGFPFQQGRRCDITIHVTPHHYKVSVNGHHHSDYNHRMPKHRVTHITIEQGIKIHSIRFEGGYPPQPSPGYPGGPSQPIYNPPVPFVHNLGGLYPNKMIVLSGIPHPGASRFTVYIQRGHHHEPQEIAMCVDARFRFGSDNNVVVRNSKISNNWGAEERHSPFFPFAHNVPFEMIILVEHNQFKVAVNNQHLLEFYHRLQPLSRVDTLRVDGDVRLTQVRFQ
uniref:Galectin n=1 Tax=Sinonovacula constricta TaxID=98310 RepID=A0A6B9SNJ2_SINCO|nr:galectin [Sinonovacula constricta]